MEPVLQAASRSARAQVRETLERLLAESHPGAEVLAEVADSLYAVVDLLDDQVSLRRVLTDPARDAPARVGLVTELLDGRVHPFALQITQRAAATPWSHPRDLTDALEDAAVEAWSAAAEVQGHLDDVEDELFRFSRLVIARSDLRAALTDRALPTERKDGLVTQLLRGRVTDQTLALVRRAVTHPRVPSIESTLGHYATVVARRRARLLAHVRTAVPLTDAQLQRLRDRLATLYQRDVYLNVELDPRVIGGLVVQVGDEVVDGTIAARLDQARTRLSGSS